MLFSRMTLLPVALSLILVAMTTAKARGQPAYTIYEVQFTTNPDGTSDYHGQVIDCAGGIVVANLSRTVPRLFLCDPAYPDGWGGIQVKDFYATGVFDGVQLGDWVELTNVEVEDFRGTTFLQWFPEHSPTLTVTSSGNPLPPPVIVAVSDIPAPVYDPVEDTWFVENHDAERWESMRLLVRDVTVTEMDLGKAEDNYALENPVGERCWAADYMNQDKPYSAYYHSFVALDQHFCAVGGFLEQYTRLSADWDYYQFLTLNTPDLAICGDGNSDGQVDLADLPRFGECLGGPLCDDVPGGCDPPAWTWAPAELSVQHCLMMDPDYDGDVDLADFGGLQRVLGSP